MILESFRRGASAAIILVYTYVMMLNVFRFTHTSKCNMKLPSEILLSINPTGKDKVFEFRDENEREWK